ncbi:3-keto-5-aminohexanoate cleavage protein [Mechercharimyces sp. CAU 1602]|uniref:3-keto-5-aminohexanoate cleavage enzyme n=1 Tax=Mechercharimyces sp. CAU 1602 TaxID=2973933 RepID=UPI0021614102|nr:3-keto-5-aminohexanoate cleavage protein [Mechercharimyces sp. CAU 1602]MCS1352327.1 3-keto-5-aminohexanoate cleavage protein [Mechercharimyces sp. CAU 1602]
MTEKLMITVALVGAEASRADHPQLPLTAVEIGKAAEASWRAGAAIAHIHVRDHLGNASQDAGLYRAAMDEIKKRCDIIIQVSTGGAVGMNIEERAQPLSLYPEMATLTTGSINFGEDVFLNTPQDIRMLARTMKENRIYPEFEIFDVGMIRNALQLVKEGIVGKNHHFDFVMGVPGAIPATASNLVHLVAQLPARATWSVAGIGRAQLPLATMAMVMGGHVRVGLEDNLYFRKGELASNEQLVARIARIAKELERPIATPGEAREILGIS